MNSKDAFFDLQFDGRPAGYRDFRRKTILAVAGQENKHAALAGPRLLQRLQGEAWRATEHLRIADLRKQDGWLEVIHALDRHYKFLPETELHEAVEEFLFHMKRKPGEGATSFSSRFRTSSRRSASCIVIASPSVELGKRKLPLKAHSLRAAASKNPCLQRQVKRLLQIPSLLTRSHSQRVIQGWKPSLMAQRLPARLRKPRRLDPSVRETLSCLVARTRPIERKRIARCLRCLVHWNMVI